MARARICLRRLAGGRRSGIVGFPRFLANPRVTVEALPDGWGVEHTPRCEGRHILAIQDSSELNFTTTKERCRGLGEISTGSGRGILLHAMPGVDAGTATLFGRHSGPGRGPDIGGRIWGPDMDTRWPDDGSSSEPAPARSWSPGKESQRWLSTAEAARTVLRQAHMVTEIRGRESDIHEKRARLPEPKLSYRPGFHILTRAMADCGVEEGGGKLSPAPLQLAGTAFIALRARPDRPARTASLVTRFGPVLRKKGARSGALPIWPGRKGWPRR